MNNQRRPCPPPASLVKGRWRRSAGGISACCRLLSFNHPSRGRACPARALPKASTPILNNGPRQPPRPHQLSARAGISPRPKNSPRGCFCPAVRWTRGPGFSIPARVTFYARHLLKSTYKEKSTTSNEVVLLGDLCVHLPRTKNNPQDCFLPPAGGRPVRFLARKHQKNSPA